MRCSEPGHHAVVAIHASRGPGRWTFGGESASRIDALCLGVFAALRFNGVDFNSETQRRKVAERICPKAGVAGGDFFHRRCSQIDADFFNVFPVICGYFPSAVTKPVIT